MKAITNIDHTLRDFLADMKKHMEKTYAVTEVSKKEDLKICRLLDSLHLLSDYEDATFINCYQIGKERSGFTGYLINVILDYNAKTKRYHSGHWSEVQLIGMIRTKKCPHVFIKPESLTEKVLDLFTNVEIDFPDHPEFCSKYYVISDNKEEAAARLNYEFCDALNRLNGPFVETKEGHLFIKFKKDSTFEDADMIASFLEEISKNKLLGGR